MKIIFTYLNLLIGIIFSLGIACMAGLTTYTQLYRKGTGNKKQVINESIKDGVFIFLIVFIFFFLLVIFIRKFFL